MRVPGSYLAPHSFMTFLVRHFVNFCRIAPRFFKQMAVFSPSFREGIATGVSGRRKSPIMQCARIFAAAILCAFICLPGQALGFAPEGKLLKVVVLSRHGVRAPTQDEKVLKMWSRKTWPVWPVERGYLTPRGARLVKAMWTDMRQIFAKKKLLPETSCPAADSIFVRADVDERTRATAQAILEGLADNCSFGYAVSKDKIDPLFHPVKAGLYRFNPVEAATNVLSMTDGGMEKLQEDLSGAVSLIGRINGDPSEKLCSRFTLTANCQLTDLPNAVSVSADGASIRLVGGLSIASSLAEIFLLEYGNWPVEAAGWGQVNASVLGQILPAHSRIFDIVNRAPVVAWARGSSLLREMTAALFGEHYDKRCNEAKLVVFVGHDTNIANIGSLLGINWRVSGYPFNGIPPGGALCLELWENAGEPLVYARFYAQPPAALHAPFINEMTKSDGEKTEFEDARTHAPVAAVVGAPPVVGQARFEADKFKNLVARSTEGAPLAPEQIPPLEYGPPPKADGK